MKSKTIKMVIFAVVFALLAVFLYWKYISPTKIALINFRDFQYSTFLEVNANPFIQVKRVTLHEDKATRLAGFDVIYMFSMGLRFNETQSQSIKDANAKGVKIYSYAATSTESDFTNILGDDLESIEGYFANGGKKNTKRLLNYSRRILDNKKLFTQNIEPPFIIPLNVLFHLGDETFFQTFDEFEKWYAENKMFKKGKQKVAVVTTNIGPRNANRDHVDMLIQKLEEKDLNVYPISGFSKRLEFLKNIDPDLVVLLPHGRFAPGDTDSSIKWLKEKNVPLICPITMFNPYDQWVRDQRGMAGGMLSQSIVVPELDGGAYPYVFGAQFKNAKGLYVFKGIENRVDTLSTLINKWLLLTKKPNSEKKIAIYYYKGPGLNAMVAGGMEVAPSLFHLLSALKENGYETGDLPSTEEELIEIINQKGPVLGAYAKGTFQKYIEEGAPELIAKDEYLKWCEATLPPEMYAEIVRDYGEAPGEYMSVQKDGKEYLAVARVQFGNIVLLPQPLPAYGDNEFQLIHGVKKAPPHTYVASYLWARHGFNCDAIMHFGTHGSLEFTPWKQVALSEYDWPDALIGGLPHFYVYVINNIGEAVIAKRRSYATILSHLTPPFTESDLYAELSDLHDKFHSYLKAEDAALKAEYLKSIKQIVLELKMHQDLGLENFEETEITQEIFDRIHNHIHAIEQEKITRGLYTLGIPYKQENAYETARLMSIDPLAYSLAKIDLLDGTLTQEQLEDAHYFDARYRKKALETIEKLLMQNADPDDFINPADNEMIENWQLKKVGHDAGDLMANMIELAEGGVTAGQAVKDRPISRETITKLVLSVAPNQEKREFLLSLKDDKKLKKAFMLLDPSSLSKARKVAKFIPEMQKVIDLGTGKDMQELLGFMQDSDSRAMVFEYLDNPEVLNVIKNEEQALKSEKINRCLNSEYTQQLFLVLNNENVATALDDWNEERLVTFQKIISFYLENAELHSEVKRLSDHNSQAVAAIMKSKASLKLLKQAMSNAQERLDELRQKKQDRMSALATYKETLYSVKYYFDAVTSSTHAETQSIINALNGGYISPSSGGDPVSNPDSVPTGRNMYSIDAEKTPTEEAWKVGKRLAQELIKTKLESTGEYPRKVAFTLWGGEFIRNQGINLAEIFYLLGVEPVRNSRGTVYDVKLIPSSELKRPRIDVIVQTSGQFRDVATSRVYLINKAVRIASEAKDEEHDNYVLEGTVKAEEVMKNKGLSPLEARNYSTARVFGGVNGNYGTGIMGLVESGDKWEDDKEISDRYLKNMGAVYTEEHWGHYQEGIFEASLQGTDTVVHPRSSNTWGPLSLDHVYEFMGGISATIRNVTGEDPEAYFNDLRNKHNPIVQGAKEAIWVETRTTLFNPKYIKALQEGGASSAEKFAETFRNTYGWNVMKPNEIDQEIWEGLFEVYVKDKYNLELEQFFKDKNPYALQEMTAVMLETIRKGYWKADEVTIKTIAELHARLVKEHKAGCSGFVCDNAKLREMIAGKINPELKDAYQKEITEARIGKTQEQKQGMKLEKEKKTLEKVKELVQENIPAILVMFLIIGVFSFAVIYGGYKQRV
jgi:cobaltochelatase CobN